MSVNLSTALAGVAAADERMRASAQRIADMAAQQASASSGSSEPAPPPPPSTNSEATAVVEQQAAAYSYVANLRVLQTQIRAEGALLDIQA